MTSHNPLDILAEGRRLDDERRTPRERYRDLLTAIAAGDPPDDASERLADILQDLRSTGHEADPTADLTLFEQLKQAEADEAEAREALESLPTEAAIRERVADLDRDIAAEFDQLASVIAKRELLAKVEPRRAAEHRLTGAGMSLSHAQGQVSGIVEKLKPKAQRIDPRRTTRQ